MCRILINKKKEPFLYISHERYVGIEGGGGGVNLLRIGKNNIILVDI